MRTPRKTMHRSAASYHSKAGKAQPSRHQHVTFKILGELLVAHRKLEERHHNGTTLVVDIHSHAKPANMTKLNSGMRASSFY